MYFSSLTLRQMIIRVRIMFNACYFFRLAIERVLDQNKLNMEIIVNNKTFPNGLNIIQLETAVGAAMKSFEGSIGKRESEVFSQS